MPEQDYTVTENLAQVIDTIQLGRKTGVLTVQRGEGSAFEGGMVIFVNGRPARAQVGYLNTAESLERLAFWRECRFAFLPYIPPDLALSSPALLSGKSPSTTSVTGKYPALPGPQSSAVNNPAFPGVQPRMPSFLQCAPYRIKQVDEAMYIMAQQGFPRIYRRLLLLLDGSRTIIELAQLFGQSPDEIYQLVSHLEAAGLVQH
ncbi:MAG TPA: DUF4388 domain-containing protein [Ktedonobacteraceae bacterium]|nr:DUF4388 domain-containing protein [Ktedonobacteraceae bacterium]